MSAWPDGLTNGRTATSWESLLARGVNCNDPAYLGDVQDACDAADLEDGIVFIPAGTYIGDVTIPDGTILWGAGKDRTIIQGRLHVGSSVTIRDLRCGATGVRAMTFQNGADDVLVENCSLFGGTAAGIVYMSDTAASNIRFVDCLISGNTSGGNGVAITDKGTAAKHYENITFERCTFRDNARMNFEVIVRQDGANPEVSGYRNINLIDCVLTKDPGATSSQLNVSYDSEMLTDGSDRSSGYSTIRGCTITGGWFAVELAGPTGMTIEGNTISDGDTDTLSMSQYTLTERANATIIGNKFSGDSDVTISGRGNTFVGNEVKLTSAIFRISGASHSTIVGNSFETTSTTAVMFENSPYNVLVNNQIRGGSNQSVLFLYAGSDDNFVDGNYIYAPSTNILDVQDGTAQRFGRNIAVTAAAVVTDQTRELRVRTLTYSASMTPDSRLYAWFKITVTNATAMTINAPTTFGFSGERITIDILNSSGGAMGVITWNAIFKLAGAFTNPASTKRRTITFYYDGTSWVEMTRAAADI